MTLLWSLCIVVIVQVWVNDKKHLIPIIDVMWMKPQVFYFHIVFTFILKTSIIW